MISWNEKYNIFRNQAIDILKELLSKKGYDEREKLRTQQLSDFPYLFIQNSLHSIIFWDGIDFVAINWEDGSITDISIYELRTEGICKLIDIINKNEI